MAGPGGGPSRKSHTKSRNGCKTCKKRHIRCDETVPQCRNCTKHHCRCDYMDLVPEPEDSSLFEVRKLPAFPISPDNELEIDSWHVTGVPPFPELTDFPRSGWYGLSQTEIFLVHHIIGLSFDLLRRGSEKCTPWAQRMPDILAIAISHEFVMSSILAFSASHLSWTTGDQDIKSQAHHHRGVAIKGLQEMFTSISNENCEPMLAASILLSWETTEWQTWVSLQRGIATILNATHFAWKSKSPLAELLESQQNLRSINLYASSGRNLPQKGGLVDLDRIVLALKQIHITHSRGYHDQTSELLQFVQAFRESLPMHSPGQFFERVRPLQRWLLWLPPAILQGDGTNIDMRGLAIIAQFFGVAIALACLLPDIGGAYLGALSIGPVEEIIRIIMAGNAADPFNTETQLALSLLEMPRQVCVLYKRCLQSSPRPPNDCHRPSNSYSSIQNSSFAPSSSSTASPSRVAYTSSAQSSPAMSMTTSPPFEPTTGRYAPDVAISHAYYPSPSAPSPYGVREDQNGTSSSSQSDAFTDSPAFSHTYLDDMYDNTPHDENQLNLNMDSQAQPHSLNAAGFLGPGLCWT